MNVNLEDSAKLYDFIGSSEKLDSHCKRTLEPVNQNFSVLKINPSLQCLSIRSEKELFSEEDGFKNFQEEELPQHEELCLSLYEKSFGSEKEEEPYEGTLLMKKSQIDTNNNSRDKLEPVRLEKKDSLLTNRGKEEETKSEKWKNLRFKREIEKLKLFWKGQTLHYPFSFKKVWSANDSDTQTGRQYVVKEDDFSNKIISFTDYDL